MSLRRAPAHGRLGPLGPLGGLVLLGLLAVSGGACLRDAGTKAAAARDTTAQRAFRPLSVGDAVPPYAAAARAAIDHALTGGA